LTVDFVGSRRELSLNIPSVQASVNATGTSVSNNIGSTSINAIIPDAYRVKITLKSLTANTRNFMAYMAQNTSPIQTGVSSGPVITSPIANTGTGFGTPGPGAQ
jgi:hypothetical protein